MKTHKYSALLLMIGLFLIGGIITSCSKKEGCTDPIANNFNSEAEKDDGSCTYDDETPEPHEETHLTFNFTHNFDGVPVTAANFNQFNFITANGDTISITKLRYLVSDFRLYTLDGDSVMLEDTPYSLIDVTNGTGLSFMAGETDWGPYTGIGFNFGFDTIANMGNYTDLNSALWNWPMMIGGGYHNMQFEGKYKVNGADSLFAYHNGTASNMGMFEQNHITVRLPGVALNHHYEDFEIQMNIAEWFRNPYKWDLATYHNMLMPNYTAQKMMQANGYNVFTLAAQSNKQ